MQSLVLEGNYGFHGMEGILDMRHDRREDEIPAEEPAPHEADHVEAAPHHECTNGQITFACIQKTYQANYKKVIEHAHRSMLPDESSEFREKIKGCESSFKTCKEMGSDGTFSYTILSETE